MLCRATQDRHAIEKSSYKTWSTGGGNGKPLQYSCCKNPMTMNSMKRQKDTPPEDEPPPLPSQKVFNMLLRKSLGQLPIAPDRMKWLSQSRNNAQLWMCLVVKVRSDAVKQNIAQEPGMLGL